MGRSDAADAADEPDGYPGMDMDDLGLEFLVLTPLARFGLLEERPATRDVPVWRRDVEVRVSPLYDRFLRFELE